jgi:hypothetical protein
MIPFKGKKGLFQHLIVVGVLIAIGVFLATTKSYTIQQEPVGEWHANFIANTLHKAEVDLLGLDQIARNSGWDVALLLAKNGGFSSKSECGVVAGRNVWNLDYKWCLPEVRKVASDLVDAKIEQNNIVFNGELLLADGVNKVVETKNGRYEYKTNIAVDLDYSFDEYAVLEQQARKLVKDCKRDNDLSKCIGDNSNWDLCNSGVIGKVGVFCVASDYVIKGNSVVYEFGLSFG